MFSLVLSFRSYIIWGLLFRFLIQVTWFIWYKIRVSIFTYGYPVVPIPCVEKYFHSSLNYLRLHQKSIGCIRMGLFVDCLFCSIDLCICFYVNVTYCLNYCSFIVCLEVRSYRSSIFVCVCVFWVFFGKWFWSFVVPFHLPYKF